jgi:hypothetical protein
MTPTSDATAVFDRHVLTIPLRPGTSFAELAERLSAAGDDGRHGTLTYVAVRVPGRALRAA